MNEVLAVAMVFSGGLFAGGVLSIALERIPAWHRMQIADFPASFAHTLRRVDRLQPALLSICLVSAIGYVLTASGAARSVAMLAVVGCVLILVSSVGWLVPIQRTVRSGSELSTIDAGELRTRWLRGHLIRTVIAVALFAVTVVATGV